MNLHRVRVIAGVLASLSLLACSSDKNDSSSPSKGRGGQSSGGRGGTEGGVGGAEGGVGGTAGSEASAGSRDPGVAGASTASGGTSSTTAVWSGGTTSTNCSKAMTAMAGNDHAAAGAGNDSAAGAPNERWVGTWVAAQQLTEVSNKPPAPGLTNNTLRQVVHVSIGGTKLRLRFSNEYGNSPVTITSVHCAASNGGHSIAVDTDKAITFNGVESVTIPAKQAITSDPVDFALTPLSNVAVTIAFGETSSDITGHPGSRTTSYIMPGNVVNAPSMNGAVTTDHWYILSGIDVVADGDTHAIVILGDSLTDGRGSTTNGNDRWPDVLARRLQENPATTKVAVLNQGIGGNAVFNGGLGPAAFQRFEKDVLAQNGVRWLILFEGVNDIGNGDATTAHNLTLFYKQFVTKAHAANLLVYGVPILPFKGHGYYSADHEAARQTVNAWIRTPGNLDGVLDFDAVVRDPAKPDTLLPAYDSGDHLHLNPAGYRSLAEAVDVCWFAR